MADDTPQLETLRSFWGGGLVPVEDASPTDAEKRPDPSVGFPGSEDTLWTPGKLQQVRGYPPSQKFGGQRDC